MRISLVSWCWFWNCQYWESRLRLFWELRLSGIETVEISFLKLSRIFENGDRIENRAIVIEIENFLTVVLLLLNWVENFLIVKISFFKLSRISRLLRLYWELRLYGIKTVETSFLKLPKIYWLLRCCFCNCWEFLDCYDVIFKLSRSRIKIVMSRQIETPRLNRDKIVCL